MQIGKTKEALLVHGYRKKYEIFDFFAGENLLAKKKTDSSETFTEKQNILIIFWAE